MSPAPTKTNWSEPEDGWSCPKANPEAAINTAASNIVLVSIPVVYAITAADAPSNCLRRDISP
jgi:hypothetical protein